MFSVDCALNLAWFSSDFHPICYKMFQGFGQAKLAYGGLVLA